jgi:ribulose-phosphate 3-epimerase
MHYESLDEQTLIHFIDFCQKNHVMTGFALNPDTPISVLFPYLSQINQILLMGVQPGFGKQSFIENTLQKIKSLRDMIDKLHLNCIISVDGGINFQTGMKCLVAGANALVIGSYF